MKHHFVLATLAIVVWHIYSVILDPEVYPMDTAWLTGKSVRNEAPHSAPTVEGDSVLHETDPGQTT